MPIICADCGVKNRDKALVCRGCGQPLVSATSQPPALPQSPRLLGQQAGPLQPVGQQPIVPRPPSGTPGPPIRIPSFLTPSAPVAPLLSGMVTTCKERRDRPPTDWNKVFFIGSLLLMFSPLILAGSALLCVVPGVAVIVSIVYSIIHRPQADVPIYELCVDDQSSGCVLNVELIGRRGGGSIEVGDEVEVHGQWEDPAVRGSVRAWRIRILSRYNSTLGQRVPGTNQQR
jgi:hypothetical protein